MSYPLMVGFYNELGAPVLVVNHGWDGTIDAQAVIRAIQMLGIREPVWLGAEAGCRYISGGGFYSRREGAHEVVLDPELSNPELSETLWHELLHAAQFEQGLPYDESAAREAQRLHDELSLTKEEKP